MTTLKPIAGLSEMLPILQQAGYTLGILTSNSKQNVKLFLDAHGISCFQFISAYADLFGKARGLRKLAGTSEFRGRPLLYVGDEVRDIEACHAAQIPVIAVTWGFNSPELLKTAHPQTIIHDPADLLEAANNLSSKVYF